MGETACHFPLPQRLRPMRVIGAAAYLLASLAVLVQPHGAVADGITAARYEAPTTRYPHGVLGDTVEYGALVIEHDRRSTRFTLPAELVFEDVAPRLWDMTGDGAPEVVTVEAHTSLGARLAIWDKTGRIAVTPHIGRAFRWLAPVAAADFDRDGAIEIAFVDRPHLAKTLRIFRFAGGRLVGLDQLRGVSNHKIGWPYIEGGLRDCGDGPEMVLATGDWRSVIVVRFDGRLSARNVGPYSAAAVADTLACR